MPSFSVSPGRRCSFHSSRNLLHNQLHALLKQRLAWLLPVAPPSGSNLPQGTRRRQVIMTTSAAASSNAAALISAGTVSSVLCGRASLAHSNGSWLQCVHTPLRRQASAGVSTRDSKSSSSSKGKNIEVRAAHKGPVNTSKGSKGKGATRSSSLGAVEPDAANMGSMEPEATKMVSVEPEATKAGPVKDEAAKAGPVGPKATKVGPVKHEATKVGPVKRATTKMGHSAGVRAERQAAHAGPVEPGDSKAGTKHGRGRPPGSGTKRAPLPARLSLQQKRKPQVKQQQPSSTEQGGSLLQGEQAYAQASKSRHVDSPAGTGLAHSSITSAQGSRSTQRSSPALPQPSSADAPVHSTSAATSHSSSWRNQYRVVNSSKSQPKAALEQQPVQLPQQPLQPNPPPAAAAISQQRLEEPKPRSPPSPSSDAARMHQHYLEQPTHRVPQQNMEFLPSQQAPQQRLAQPTQQAPQQRNMDFMASQQPLQQDTERPARGSPQLRSLHAARTPQQSLKNLAPQAPQQQHPLPLDDTSQQPNKPPIGGSIGTSSASTNVEQPTATLKDPQQPTAILKDPQQPTAILDRPQQPTTTRKHPQQLTATLKNPKQPTTTRKDPQQPTATLEAPQHLIAASEHRKWPTATLLKDPKQLTALIRHCHNLDQLADLLHRHCGISAINHSALQRTRNLNGSFDGTVGPWSLSGSGATAHVQGRGGGGGGGGAAAQSSSSYGFFEGSSSSSSSSTGGGIGRLTKGRRRRSSDSIAPSETLNGIGNERDTAEAGASPTEAAAGQEPEQAPIRTLAAALTAPPAQSPQPPAAGTQPPPCLDGVALSAALHRLAVLAPVPDANDANTHSSDAGHNGRVSTSHELGSPSAAPAPLHSAGAADTSSDSSSGSAPISATSVARHESGAPRSNAPTDGAASGSPAFPASTPPPRTPPHPVSLGTQQPLQPSAVAGAGGAAAAGAAVSGVPAAGAAVSGVPAAGAAGVAAAAGAAGGAAAAEALERDGDRRSLPTFGCAEDAQRLADALLEAGMTNGLLQDMGWRELSSLLWSAAHLGFRACAHTDNFAIDAQDSRPSAAAAFAAEQQQGRTGRAVHPITGQSPAPWIKAVLQRMASIGFQAADAQALSNTIWALSRLGVVPGQAWMMSYLQAVQTTLPRLQAQHLTNILYALAKLHLLQRQQEQEGRLESLLPPAEAWMSAFLHEVYHAMPHPSTLLPLTTNNTTTNITTNTTTNTTTKATNARGSGSDGGDARVMGSQRVHLKHTSHDAHLQPELQQLQQQQHPQLRQLHPKQQQQQQQQEQQHLQQHNHHHQQQQQQQHPQQRQLQASMRASAGPSFLMSTPQQYANLLYALAIFAVPPPSLEWLARFWAASAALLRSHPPVSQESFTLDFSQANPLAPPSAAHPQQHQTQQHHAHHLSSLRLWQRQRLQVQWYPSSVARPQHLSNLVWATAKMRACAAIPRPPVWWMQTVEVQLRCQAPLLAPQELANVVYAYGLMWSRPGHPRTLPLLLSWALQHARWGQLTPQGVANIVWGAARVHIAKDPSRAHTTAAQRHAHRGFPHPRQPQAGTRKPKVLSSSSSSSAEAGVGDGGGGGGGGGGGSYEGAGGEGGAGGGSVRQGSRAAEELMRSQPAFDGVWLRQLLQAFQHSMSAGPSGSAFALQEGGQGCSGFTAQAVANILWGAAIVGADPGEEAVQWLIMQAGEGQGGVPSGAASAVFWGSLDGSDGPHLRGRDSSLGGCNVSDQGDKGGPDHKGRVGRGCFSGFSGSNGSEQGGSNDSDQRGGVDQELWDAFGQCDVEGGHAHAVGSGDTLRQEGEVSDSCGLDFEGPAGRQIRWALQSLGYQ